MSEQHLDRLEERLGLQRLAPEPDDEAILADRLPDVAVDLEGWMPVRVENHPDGSPPSCSAFLRPADVGGSDVVFRVDAYLLDSARSAHEHLVRLLAEFQSPDLRVLEGSEIGELVVGYRETALVTRRANVVVVVRNAGSRVEPVLDLAKDVDAALRRIQNGSGPR